MHAGPTQRLDITELPSATARGRVFRALEALDTGEQLELRAGEDPSLLLQAANLYLRHRLQWEITRDDAGHWRASVERQSEEQARNLTDLLTLDHQRVDSLFAEVLKRANAGDLAGARSFADAFALALKRHVYAENEILAESFPDLRREDGRDPVSTMIDEHRGIEGQLDEIQTLLRGGEENLLEIQVLAGMLSGLLAKHEGREEQNVFPLWEAAIQRFGEAEIFERVRAVLQGQEDAVIPLGE